MTLQTGIRFSPRAQLIIAKMRETHPGIKNRTEAVDLALEEWYQRNDEQVVTLEDLKAEIERLTVLVEELHARKMQ